MVFWGCDAFAIGLQPLKQCHATVTHENLQRRHAFAVDARLRGQRPADQALECGLREAAVDCGKASASNAIFRQ
jgi:hypothetical protein